IWSNSFTINMDKVNTQIVDQQGTVKHFDSSIYWMNSKLISLHQPTGSLQSHLVFEKRFSHLNAVRFGGEYDYADARLTYNHYPVHYKDNYAALFAETDAYFTNDFVVKLGGRAEHSSLMNQSEIAPRASLAYRAGNDGQLSAAYGIFYQKPDNMYLMYNQGMKFTKATHYIINYQKSTTQQLFRVEAYYKKYDDLVKTIGLPHANFTYDNAGYGSAKGVDVFWKDQKSIKDFEYWISYSYIYTRRDFLNYTQSLQPDFVAPHTLSVVAKKFVTKIKTELNLVYNFATGRPYYDFTQSQPGSYDLADRGKTMDYNDVDFSVDYLPSIGKRNTKCFITIVATVKNLFAFKQIYGYAYSYNGSNKLPVISPTRQQFFAGIFFNFGVDRSKQIINDNL
ncbi:MAG TPA: TonB-dependent receptor, partial [Arachidicoccus sp.]